VPYGKGYDYLSDTDTTNRARSQLAGLRLLVLAWIWASLYLGSDGMARDGRFLMYGYLTDRVFEAPRMRFAQGDELPRESTAASNAVDLLQQFKALRPSGSLSDPACG
jgi:hypothetical protein